jgi:hypothetical protein
MAVSTVFDKMINCKIIPVPFLIRRQHPGTVAEGANTSQGLNDCTSNKLGSVRDVPYFIQQILINLECDNFLFFLHELKHLSSSTVSY